MNTSHLITNIKEEEIDVDNLYDIETVKSSLNEILGVNSSLEQSSEDWMQNVSAKVEGATERYVNSAIDYMNGAKQSLEGEAKNMAETMHSLDQSLEVLSFRTGLENQDYKKRLLEIKNRLEEEVIAPVTAEALQYREFTENIPEEDVDYLLRPVKNNYLDES